MGHLEDGFLRLEEVYRFENRQVRRGGHDCWDLEHLWQQILEGLRACKQAGKIPQTIGIDTWGVDFVLLDDQDRLLTDAVAYRDSRTAGMAELVARQIAPEELYRRTGIQYQCFNTLYQLVALKQEQPEVLEKAKWFLMVPEYLNFLLTGIKCNEYTNNSTTNLLHAEEKTWDTRLLEKLGLPTEIFHKPELPGKTLGRLLPRIRELVGFDAQVILPATHDTGSAFLAVPSANEESVYLSSGTWSLLGVENHHAITTVDSYRGNFTNEGGAWYRYRYLKNIMGLWMIQSVRRELNGVAYIQGKQNVTASEKQWSFPELIAEARQAEAFPSVVDVNKERFLSPDSMIRAIEEECAETGQPVPKTVGQLMQCIYSSLSLCYRDAIGQLQKLTGKTYTGIHIVGGGCQDAYLNQRTAQATGLPVYAGPVEGTAVGNLLVQMIAEGEIRDLSAARQTVRTSFEIEEFKP